MPPKMRKPPAKSKIQKSSQNIDEMFQHLQEMEGEYKKIKESYSGGFQDPRYIEREGELEEDIDTYKKKVEEARLRDFNLDATKASIDYSNQRKEKKASERRWAEGKNTIKKKMNEYRKREELKQIEYQKRLKAEKKQKEKEERERNKQRKEANKKTERDPREQMLRKAKKSKNIPMLVKLMREDAKKQEVPVISDKVRQGKPDGEMVMYKDTEYEVMFDEEYNLFVLITTDTGELEFYLDPTI